MSVRIPISADPASAKAAFDDIRRAIQRAGQEGKRFEDIDFSHPELKELASEIDHVHKQWQALTRLPGSTRKRLSTTGQSGQPVWGVDFNQMYGGNQTAAQRAMAQAGAYVLPGTRWQARGAGGAGAAPDDGGAGALAGAGMAGGALKMLKATPVLGAALSLGGATTLAYKASEQSLTEARDISVLRRSMHDVSDDFDGFRRQVRAAGEGLALTYLETVRLTKSWANLTAETDRARAAVGVNAAVGFARSAGMDPGAVTQQFGNLQYMGAFGNSPGDLTRFATQIGDAVGRAGIYPKADLVLHAVTRFTETMERSMVHAPNTDDFLRVFSVMQRQGMQEGKPGLMGDQGENILATMGRSIQSPGGGEAGDFFMMRALGPDLGPFKLEFLRSEGMFGSRKTAFGEGDETTTFERVMRQLKHEYGDRDPFLAYSAMSRLFNISPNQAKEMWAVHQEYSSVPGGGIGGISGLLDRAGIDISRVDASSLMDLARLAHGTDEDVEGYRSRILSDDKVPDGQKRDLESLAGDELRAAVANIVAQRGMEKDLGYESMQVRADLSDTFTALGDNLGALNVTIKQYAAQLGGLMNGADSMQSVKDSIMFDSITLELPVNDPSGNRIGSATLHGRNRIRAPQASGLGAWTGGGGSF